MTPPKITRPLEKPVEHTFPAWYRYKENGTVAFMQSKFCGFIHLAGKDDEVGFEKNLIDCTKHAERLPSGSKIEFTQP